MQPSRPMASFPCEVGWEALKGQDTGPGDHTRAASKQKGVSPIPGLDYLGQPMKQKCPYRQIQHGELSGPHTAPPTLQALQET